MIRFGLVQNTNPILFISLYKKRNRKYGIQLNKCHSSFELELRKATTYSYLQYRYTELEAKSSIYFWRHIWIHQVTVLNVFKKRGMDKYLSESSGWMAGLAWWVSIYLMTSIAFIGLCIFGKNDGCLIEHPIHWLSSFLFADNSIAYGS